MQFRPIMRHAFRRVPGATPPLQKVTAVDEYTNGRRLERLSCGHGLVFSRSAPRRERRRCLECLSPEQAARARRA